MYLTSEVKKEIFAQYGKNEADTGSPEAQIALFTHRIKHLTEHVKENNGDRVTKRALITLVGKRKKMLEYLKRQDIERYRAIIKQLGLRK
jgi:small subunit ribosomal protein S15